MAKTKKFGAISRKKRASLREKCLKGIQIQAERREAIRNGTYVPPPPKPAKKVKVKQEHHFDDDVPNGTIPSLRDKLMKKMIQNNPSIQGPSGRKQKPKQSLKNKLMQKMVPNSQPGPTIPKMPPPQKRSRPPKQRQPLPPFQSWMEDSNSRNPLAADMERRLKIVLKKQ